MAAIKTIVYDWNGTLFDDVQAVCRCFSLAVEKFGLPSFSLDRFQTCFDMPLEKMWRGLGLNDSDLAKLGPNLVGDFHEHYEPLSNEIRLRDGAACLLAQAKALGVNQLILSNHLVDPILQQLRRLNADMFISRILANATKERQFLDGPKSERLRAYMAENGIRPSQTLIIGDSPEETVIARELGLISVALTGGFVSEARLREAKPDYLFHSLSDVIPLLRESEAA